MMVSGGSLARLEVAARRLQALDVELGGVCEESSSLLVDGALAQAEAELDELRGQLLSMRVVPASERTHTLERTVCSLAAELHRQRAGSAAAMAALEKQLRLAKRRARASDRGARRERGEVGGDAHGRAQDSEESVPVAVNAPPSPHRHLPDSAALVVPAVPSIPAAETSPAAVPVADAPTALPFELGAAPTDKWWRSL